ncbi:procathepsin L-like isoform X1 [Dipodomys merriami]|uniref:procathepsin L-like isoform X1 n=1 Tax=Dipodomys merriami TaxID=94247 RepID=UPI00385609DA
MEHRVFVFKSTNTLLLLAILCLGMASTAPTFDHSLDAQWEEWKMEYNKTYSSNEELYRRAIWEKNMKMIEIHNEEYKEGKHSFTLAMNDFGDMTKKEIRERMMGLKIPKKKKGIVFQERLTGDVPDYVDWRGRGYVTPVMNQGACNACWAFSAAGALEGQMFRKTGRLIALSKQNLVDCSQPQGNYGCSGGWMDHAFEYVYENGGLDSEAAYPYEDQEGPCRYRPEYSAATDTGTVYIPPSEEVLKRAVAIVGPISAAIDASHDSFNYYIGGIYDEPACSNTSVTHAVLVVGYGYERQQSQIRKYWLVKNSWGTNWGIRGYIKIARDENNYCGIASYASFPTV